MKQNLNLWELLKASRGFPVSDPMARLWGYQYQQKHGVSEISGVPPLQFKSHGGYLQDCRIYGNTVQNGTPTPENPVEVHGCGERTENLAPPYSDLVSGFVNIEGDISPPYSTRNEKASKFFSVSPNTTYTFSFRDGQFPRDGIEAPWCGVGYYDADYKFIVRFSDTQATPLTTNAPPEAKYARISYRSFDTTESTMFVEGSTSPDHYIPYGYKIPVTVSNGTNSVTTPVYIGSEPLHKIDDYADYVDFKRGVVVRRICKVVLTGEKSYAREETYQRFIASISGAKIEGLRLTRVYCTHFLCVYDGRPISEVPNNSIYTSDVVTGFFFIKTTDYTTPADFKSYLAAQYAAGTPVTIWYVLAEPEEEPLENLLPIQTIKGSDVLTVGTTVQPSNIWIKGKIKAID